jgi:hypothetical protein
MELDKFHVHEFRSGMVSHRVTISSVFPAVACDLESAPDPARGEDDRFRLKDVETAFLAFVGKGTDHSVAVLEQPEDSEFHEHVHTLMDAVILQGADHFESGPITDVGQSRVSMSAEVSLQDASVSCAIE